MSSNRYTNLSFNSLNDVGLLQLPFEQIDEMLKSQQGQINMQQGLQQMVPKHIQESKYATEAVKQLVDYQKGIRNQLVDIAKTGNTRGYMAGLAEANNKLANLYKPGGLAYNLEQDYATYQTHVAKEQERLSKGEITPEQFQMSIKKPLVDYDTTQGIKRYNPTLKPQAVNFDKFATDFVKQYEDTDLVKRGNFRVINGRMVYDDTKITGVEAQRVLRDLSNAYSNAASATGQLKDMFDVRNQNNDIVTDFKTRRQQEMTDLISLINNTNKTNKTSVKKLQSQLNELGLDTGGIDGSYGPKTKQAVEGALYSANQTLSGLQTGEDADFSQAAEKDFYNQYVNTLASPYANATARQKEATKFTDFGETFDRFKAEEDYKAKKAKEVEETKNMIIPTMPFDKAVPKDIPFYGKNGKLYKNTNASADALDAYADKVAKHQPGIILGGGFVGLDSDPVGAVVYRIGAFFDRLFTDNDEADFSVPTLANIRDHMAANTPGFWNLSDEEQLIAVQAEIDRQSKEPITGATFTATTDSKYKENLDKVFGVVKYDKNGNITYDPGILTNLKVKYRDNGKEVSGGKFLEEVADGDFGKNSQISVKGFGDNWKSLLPYGTTVLGVGNDEVHVEPDVTSSFNTESYLNGAYRAMNNAEVGYSSSFKYGGQDMQAIYRPDDKVDIYFGDGKTKYSVLQPIRDTNGNVIDFKETKVKK